MILRAEKEREKDGASRKVREVEQNSANWVNVEELLTCPGDSLRAP